MMVYACNHNSGEAEAERLGVQGQSNLHRKTLSQKKTLINPTLQNTEQKYNKIISKM
jgi:hypothetical protein